MLYFLCLFLVHFCFPLKRERWKKLFIYPKQILNLACTLTLSSQNTHLTCPLYGTEQCYWRWWFWYFWRWVLIHHNNQIAKQGQSWISLYYSAVWRDMHRVKITVLIQSKAGIGLNSLIPHLMDMLCLLITLIRNQFWMCIDSNAPYLGYWVLEKLFGLHS